MCLMVVKLAGASVTVGAHTAVVIRADQGCGHSQRCEIKSCLMLDFSIALPAAFKHDDRLQPGPVMALLKPRDVIDHRCGMGLDPAVIAIDGGIAGDGCIGKVFGLLFCGEQLDVLAQRPLVGPECQDIIRLLFEYGARDRALAADGIDRHDRALDWRHRGGVLAVDRSMLRPALPAAATRHITSSATHCPR
jgi:hypothetical protein